jgi:hypothetical protein
MASDTTIFRNSFEGFQRGRWRETRIGPFAHLDIMTVGTSPGFVGAFSSHVTRVTDTLRVSCHLHHPKQLRGKLSGLRLQSLGSFLFWLCCIDATGSRPISGFFVRLGTFCVRSVPISRVAASQSDRSRRWKPWQGLVGAARFELATPGPPDRCANRAALRSDAAMTGKVDIHA